MSALRASEEPRGWPTASLAEVACNLCGSFERQVLFDAGADGRVVRCKVCGLGFVSPRPTNVTSQYEGERYFTGGEPSAAATRGSPTPHGYESYLEDRGALRPYFGRLLDAIDRRRGATSSRLLEVGCAAGFFLDQARGRGYQVAGVEPSPAASEVARDRLGLPVQTGILSDARLEPAAWDVIVLLQTIEHVPDPAETLEELRQLLRPGGLLLLTTPDERSWLRTVMGNRWIGYKPPEHLWHFDARTISLLLRKHGFEGIEVGRDLHRYPPRWLLRRGGHYLPRLRAATRASERVLPDALLDGFALPVHWGSLAAWATRPLDEAPSR